LIDNIPVCRGGRTMRIIKTAGLAALLIPLVAQTAAHRESPIILFDIDPDEQITLNLAVLIPGDTPIPDNTSVDMNLRFSDLKGIEIGTASQNVTVSGFGTFSIRNREASPGVTESLIEQFLLLVNDQVVGIVQPDQNGRMLLRVDVRVARWGRNRATGEEVPIPASSLVRGFSTTIDRLTGQTLATKSFGSMLAEWAGPN
jgi:nucleoid DNA-binding protein